MTVYALEMDRGLVIPALLLVGLAMGILTHHRVSLRGSIAIGAAVSVLWDRPNLLRTAARTQTASCGDDGTRTHDPRLAKPMLFQLSYVPEYPISS